MAPKSLNYVTISLRISSILYLIVAVFGVVFLLAMPEYPDEFAQIIMRVTWISVSAMSVGMIVFVEIVIKALKKGRYWAWVAGLCLAGLYIPSAFALPGIFMLIGLLKDETRAWCIRKPEPAV